MELLPIFFGDHLELVNGILNSVVPGLIHECPYKGELFANVSTANLMKYLGEPLTSKRPYKNDFSVFPDGIYKIVLRWQTPQDQDGILIKYYVRVKRGDKKFY
jgi:hypothetical protein